MPNRQIFPETGFPILLGDVIASTGATSCTVVGIQGIPIIAPPVEPVGLDTLFYDSYNNDWFYASPWDIPVGIPLVWEGYGYGSSGISWIAPDTLAFGNGTDGDVSGAAAMTALVLFGSASYYGPYSDYDVDYGPSYDQFYTSIFSGATQNWNLILPPNPGSSGQVLTTNGTGVTYWSTVASSGGSVTSFSSGNLSPLFTTSVATSTTTPALSFALNTQNANLVFAGPVSGGAATPTFRALVPTDIPVPGSTGDILYNNGGVLGATLTTITAAGSITIPDTQVVKWTGSAYSSVGLSQLAADTLAVGNGSESDVSGAMAMTAIILYGASYYSAYDAFHTTIYSGATQNWNLVLPETAGVNGQVLVNIGSGFTEWESVSALIPSGTVLWNQIGNPSSALILSMGTYGTEFDQTAAVVWAWSNTTAATSSTTKHSPQFVWEAQFWDGALSQADNWVLGSALAAGTNAATKMSLIHSSGSSGFASFTLGNTVNPVALQFDAIGAAATIDFATNTSWTLQFTDSNSANTDAQLIFAAGASLTLESGAATQLILEGNLTTQNAAAVKIQNANSFTGTSNQFICNILGTFAPTSGSATFFGNRITTTINQTGSASGGYEVLALQAVETALLGTANYLIFGQAGSAGTTTKFTLDNKGNIVQTIGTTSAIANSPSLTLTGSYESSASGPTYAADSWSIQDVLQAATLNGTSTLTFTHSGSSGAAAVSVPQLVIATASGTISGNSCALEFASGVTYVQTSGTINLALNKNSTYSVLNLISTGGLSWASGSPASTSADTTITRNAAGIVQIGTTGSSAAGTMYCARLDSSSADMQGRITSAPSGIACTNVVVAVGGLTAVFTLASTEELVTGDTIILSASGWTAGSGLASTTCTVTTITNSTTATFTYVSGGPWVAGTYSAQSGTIAQTGGTVASYTYATAYANTPTVVVTPTSNCGAFYISSSSTTGFSITYANSGTQTFNYHVMGNPT